MKPGTCIHFTGPEEQRCAAGVSYLLQAGGGVHNMILRLPCVPISNRRGETARECKLFGVSHQLENRA